MLKTQKTPQIGWNNSFLETKQPISPLAWHSRSPSNDKYCWQRQICAYKFHFRLNNLTRKTLDPEMVASSTKTSVDERRKLQNAREMGLLTSSPGFSRHSKWRRTRENHENHTNQRTTRTTKTGRTREPRELENQRTTRTREPTTRTKIIREPQEPKN